MSANPTREPRPARVIVLDDAAPVGAAFWTSPEDAEPVYTSGEVSHCFLGLHRRWLVELLRDEPEVAEGMAWSVVRGRRLWGLHDIERLIHHLTERDRLPPLRARYGLLKVKCDALQRGLLDPE